MLFGLDACEDLPEAAQACLVDQAIVTGPLDGATRLTNMAAIAEPAMAEQGAKLDKSFGQRGSVDMPQPEFPDPG